MIKLLFVLCTVLFMSCADSCKDGEYRCKDQIEEVCADDDWLESADCSEIFSLTNKVWVCCESTELFDGGPGCDFPENCE